MKILVSGATGLVGSVLLEQAIAQGYEIHFLTTRKNQLDTISEAKGFYWNPKKNEIDFKCFEGVEVLIHLAGASISQRWTTKNKKEILDSRVDGTNLLVNTLKQFDGNHQLKQVVAASAIGIYPSSFSSVYTEEYTPQSNSFLEEVVIAWEKAEDGFARLGIKLCKLRIGLVLTAKGGVLGPLKTPTWFGLGAAFGNGQQTQSWIHVDDLVNLSLQAATDQWEGIFNAVSPQPVSQKEFTRTLAKAMRRPYFMPSLPQLPIRLVMGEMSTLIFNSQNVSAAKVVQKGFMYQYPDLFPAIKSLL
jgi:uncharacterized protein (TIGR01777 family)